MNKIVVATLLPAFVAALSLAACADEPEPIEEQSSIAASSLPAPKTDMTLPLPNGLKGDPDKAAVFYLQNCATCHGTSGDGEGPRAYFINPPPRNFLLTSSRQRLNRPTLFNAISHGIIGSEMPAWNKVLSDQEIANLAEFVFQTFILAPQEGREAGTSGK